jgi:hypothetical protein
VSPRSHVAGGVGWTRGEDGAERRVTRRREEGQGEKVSGGWRGRVAPARRGFFSSVCLEKEADAGGDGDSCRPWPLLPGLRGRVVVPRV